MSTSEPQSELEKHIGDLSLSPRDVSISALPSPSEREASHTSNVIMQISADNLTLNNTSSADSIDGAREGVQWVDMSNMSPEARIALGEKDLGDEIVVIKDLTKEYLLPGREEHIRVLRGVNLHGDCEVSAIREGEFCMIRGPSGGGKTTLLNMIGTVDAPSSGMISIFGSIIDNKCKDAYLAKLRLQHIGFVFQTFNLLSTMSAYENVSLPMVIAGNLSQTQIRTRTLQLLAVVGLQDRAAHLPSELSGGEQQRVTIARALSNRPKLLLLDEPTGDLDTRNTIEVMDILLRINREYRTTCVMVTHNPDLECYSDRIIYMEDGVIKKQAINDRQMKLNFEHYMRHIGNVYGEKDE